MNREQLLIGLVLSVPPSVGVLSAIHLSAPSMLPTAVAAAVVTFGAIFGVVWLAVDYNPEIDEEVAHDSNWPHFEDDEGGADPGDGDAADADAGDREAA